MDPLGIQSNQNSNKKCRYAQIFRFDLQFAALRRKKTRVYIVQKFYGCGAMAIGHWEKK